MARVSMAPPWCWRCGADEDDGATLFAARLARSYWDSTIHRQRTVSIAIRCCRSCAQGAADASARVRRDDWFARAAPVVRARVAGRWASRAQMAQASRASPLLPMAATTRDR